MLEHLGARGVGRRWCLCQAGDLVLTWPLGGPWGLCMAGRERGLLLGAGNSQLLISTLHAQCCQYWRGEPLSYNRHSVAG